MTFRWKWCDEAWKALLTLQDVHLDIYAKPVVSILFYQTSPAIAEFYVSLHPNSQFEKP